MIGMKKVGLSYGPKVIFENLNCAVEAGDFVMIIGPNGVGKTTLFDLVSGVVLPDQGEIFVTVKTSQKLITQGGATWCSEFSKTHRKTLLVT